MVFVIMKFAPDTLYLLTNTYFAYLSKTSFVCTSTRLGALCPHSSQVMARLAEFTEMARRTAVHNEVTISGCSVYVCTTPMAARRRRFPTGGHGAEFERLLAMMLKAMCTLG